VKLSSEEQNILAATIQRRGFIHSLLWTKEQEWSFPASAAGSLCQYHSTSV